MNMTGSFKVQLINMGTRAAAFQAKLRSLHDFHLRLLHNVVPPPSGLDIANTLKYFSQTLMTVLKDVPNSPLSIIKDPTMDHMRMSGYPNLEYSNLYNALAMLLDVAPSIQYGVQTFGKAVLQCFGCILPFLDKDLIDNLPYLCASAISVLPPALHQDIVNSLCYYILPFTITRQSEDDQESQASQSVAAVIMLIFQYSNNPAHHCQLLECLMTLKHNVAKDLLCVIAYGTSSSRSAAAKLLFYYWPPFNTDLFDRKVLLCKYTNDLIPFVCQRDQCPNAGNAEAAKVCYDHRTSILYASDTPPPLYLCIECANEIHREHSDLTFGDLLHPMQQVSMICENKNCRATEKQAISICFAQECASYNGNHPIRYCAQCHGNRHNNRRGGDHIVHKSLPSAWLMDPEMQTYMIESVISLLREAKPLSLDFQKDSTIDSKQSVGNAPQDNISLEERQQLGRYGIWLLVGRCTPTSETPIEILGRLLSMLFHWFHITAYSYDGPAESNIEKLKMDHVCGWLRDISKNHYKDFIACLLPHPPEYSRVGGHWDTLASRTSHLREGLQRLICLVPYEVITQDIWDVVMPHWMEAITNDVPEKELGELKIVLNKILDHDMSPLGFDAQAMYNFVRIRFEKTTAKVQQQALHWLQILSKLEILIPLPQLFSMFGDGVRIMKVGVQHELRKDGRHHQKVRDNELVPPMPRRSSISPVVEDDSGNTSAISDDEAPAASRNNEFSSDSEHNLTCCILMLDILLKQMELQDVEQHMGISTTVCENVCRLLKCMVTAARVGLGSHVCALKVSECGYCEASVMWHQLSAKLVQFMAPEAPVRPPDVRKPIGPMPLAVPQPEQHSIGGVLVHMPHVCSIMTATVETVAEPLDLAAIMPSENVVSAIARSVTLTDTDVATATASVARPQIIGDSAETIDGVPEDEELEDGEEFWQTSVGRFKFSIDQLPQPLQYIHQLLTEISNIDKPDILYYMLQCLNVLVLHGDALTKAARDHRGFFIWCQENLLIKSLWGLCNSQHSHICEVSVPLLLHAITLPLGSDVFWRIINDAFNDSDWRVRFQSVERVTVIARFMDSTPLRSEVGLQASLAAAFCHLIASVDDINVQVAQRATLYIGTIHDSAIHKLLYCLESQFDMFIVDRPVVLQSIYQLHNLLCDRKILTWEFFLNRFDTLFVEAQISLEKTGELSYLRDLRNSENGSEFLSTKINKAREALNQSDSSGSMTKTLSASFGGKYPYKRTMSAPATIIPRQESKIEKEKTYARQQSAPILKRKSSRFGLESHFHSIGGGLDEINAMNVIYRIIDIEESDKETIHLLVFLLMQFMSRSDLAYPTDEKPKCKIQAIVLKHLYLLLGYTEKSFHTIPLKLRCSAVFNAFLSNLPQVLDQNSTMGMMMVPTIIQVLLFAPSPCNQVGGGMESMHNISLTYSLWYLEPHARRNWLMSILVILYKYNYVIPPLLEPMQNAVRIIMNSIEAQFHVCRRIPATVMMDFPSSRSRDLSQPSLGPDINDEKDEKSSPPASPMPEASSASAAQLKANAAKKAFKKYNDSSLENDETESELVAIPESESDSTLAGHSAGTSFDDTTNFEEVCTPLRLEQIPKNKNLAHEGGNYKIHDKGEDRVEVNRKVTKLSAHSKSVDLTDRKINITTSSTTVEAIVQTTVQTKCSVQEGMRMMVSSALMPDKATVNPPANVQKAVVVTQSTKTSPKEPTSMTNMMASIAQNQAKAFGAFAGSIEKKPSVDMSSTSSSSISSEEKKEKPRALVSPTQQQPWQDHRGSSSPRHLGRQKRVIDPTVPISSTIVPSSSTEGEQFKVVTSKPPHKKSFKNVERTNYGSPESPLSKMDIMSPPTSSGDVTETLMSPKSIASLEIPTQERLLPIGSGKDNIATLADRVREALVIPDISHLRQDSTEKSESTTSPKEDITPTSRGTSPRRLKKQFALHESPPNVGHSDDVHSTLVKSVTHDIKVEKHNGSIKGSRQRLRKVGPFAIGSQTIPDSKARYAGSWAPQNKDDSDMEDEAPASNIMNEIKQSTLRVGEDTVCDRCMECGAIKEIYTDEEMGLFLITIGTFIHREPAIAAPYLPDILQIVSKVALHVPFPWQSESLTHLPGNSQLVAYQFIRCVLHQLAPNGVFYQIFLTQANENVRKKFYRSVAQALLDFADLNTSSPVHFLCESLNTRKNLPVDVLPVIIRNLSEYLHAVPNDSVGANMWVQAVQGIEGLYRRILLILPSLDDAEYLLTIMISILKVPGLNKNVLDPFSKVLSFSIQNLTLKHKTLHDLCILNTRAFTKDRDKFQLCRQIVFELVQALKFKTSIPDSNLLLMVGMVLQDAGGALPPNFAEGLPDEPPTYSNYMAENMRQYLGDVMEFLTDFHTLSKIKNFKTVAQTTGLSEDTIGGCLKGAIAQYLALEMSRGNSRDNRAISRYLPWLYNAPSSLQQGPKEFTECVGHMRIISWLLMGSLTHTALTQHKGGHTTIHGAAVHYHGQTYATPVPQEASCHIADHIQVIFAGFAEQSKTSVLHMSSFFHVFTLCQLWTVYLEQIANASSPASEAHNITMSILFEFWAKVTPCILQLISTAKSEMVNRLSEMVNLHFLSMLEALMETRSTILSKLLPMWGPILTSNTPLSGTLLVRLQTVRDMAPNLEEADQTVSDALLKWLQRLQFKMGQIELQSSTATQFYSI
ncbi:protein unc-79 homolog isoform X4 [Culicoides brevitarsis]|uniref:protein unc-79 homolog isoform X4 n=1 Tax=Culicoides brevitarsis TaxID=469753 RepID=UPI00307BABD6